MYNDAIKGKVIHDMFGKPMPPKQTGSAKMSRSKLQHAS